MAVAHDVLVTGGAGFVGSHLVRGLVHEGHRVVVADNLSTMGSLALLADVRARIEFAHVDVRVPADLARLPSRPWDRVYHLAASFANARSIADPELDEQTNLHGTAHVLAHARARGCGLFVYTGSSSSYGDVAPPFREDGPMRPGTPYARTKLGAEALVRTSGLPSVVMRLFNVYGPGDPPGPWRNAIPNMVRALFAEGRILVTGADATRDFTYVGDVVPPLLGAARAVGETLNVGTGVETRVRDVAEQLLALFDAPRERLAIGPRRDWDRVERRVADVTRLRERFGRAPETRLAEGLRATARWLHEAGVATRAPR